MATILQSVVTAIALCLVKATFASGSSNQEFAVNQSIFAPKGDIAAFNLKKNLSVFDLFFRHRTHYIARIMLDKRPEQKHRYEIGYHFATFYLDDSFQGRSNVTAINLTEETAMIMITISDLVPRDNGTYDAYDHQKGIIACWRLFVLNLKQIQFGIIIENEGVRILAQPAAFLINDLGTKATMVWLFDGEYLNQTEYFTIQVGGIWTSRVPRALNGRHVTYRAVQNDETLSEINLTLKVAYGPNPPLTLLPSTAFYTLEKGETMPNIECKADCNPLCLVAWEGSNSTDVLRLGKASTSMSGEYTCSARNLQNGTSRVVKASIFVFLTGGSACQLSCQQKENIKMESAPVSSTGSNQNVNQGHGNTFHYEALDAATRQKKWSRKLTLLFKWELLFTGKKQKGEVWGKIQANGYYFILLRSCLHY